MKTKLFILIAIVLAPYLLTAQSASKEIFDKYAGRDGFTSVVLSGDLFKMLVSDNNDVNIGGTQFNTKGFNLSSIKGIRLLNISDNEGKNANLISTLIKETEAAFAKDKPKYTELVQLQTGGEKINVLALKQNNMINEFVVYRRNSNEKEVTLIYVEGPFKEDMVNKVIKDVMK